jgi:multiple antibiotic resistance protein
MKRHFSHHPGVYHRRSQLTTRTSSAATMEYSIKPFITLLAIVNPIGVIPFFIHFTQKLGPGQQRRTARIAAFSSFLVIALSALAGLKIIEFFGITLASFQVGGGILLLISAMNMLNAEPAESRAQDVEQGASKADTGASVAVVPLTIPLLTGPATISTVVIYSEKTKHIWELGVLVLYGLVIGLAIWITLSAADRIGRFLGTTGINVMTRLMGLILAAIGVEVMSDGLLKLFPALGH